MLRAAWRSLVAFVVLLGITASLVDMVSVDPKGYVMFCPCMGRFGNQADHYLGALSFAHGLDRTLVLPPWVEYHPGKAKSVQVPFDKYFKVSAMREYHRVITMHSFMKELAPQIWPVGKRIVMCYSSRHGADKGGCNAKDGNPFKSFWDTFKIDFDDSAFYGPLYYNANEPGVKDQWDKKFPAKKYPVLAFTGAPGAFPVREVDVKLHKYLRWSQSIEDKAEAFIKNKIVERPYIGIHLRNGVDWTNACEHASDGYNMFGSAQCLGYNQEHGKVTKDLCFPPKSGILDKVEKHAKKLKAKVLFVAADDDNMKAEFERRLKSLKVKVVTMDSADVHVELALLAKADHFIGNCVSTFSSFAARERLMKNKPNSFWHFESRHEEL